MLTVLASLALAVGREIVDRWIQFQIMRDRNNKIGAYTDHAYGAGVANSSCCKL